VKWELWLAFVGASIAISVSPGAGAIQSMSTGLTHGLRRGVDWRYLVYLAIRQWRTTAGDLTEQLAISADGHGGRLALLCRGALVNLTNPKGLVFLLAVLPQFVIPTRPLLPQYLTIAATMTVVDVIVMCGYTGLSARLLRWLRTPRQQMVLNRTMASLFALAAVVLSLVRRGATA